MYQIKTLKNGLTLITIDIPALDSVTTLIAVGAGSRYETKSKNGISHFLEHMFFKGSRKYTSAEEISTLIDGIGAVNNASTSKEITTYWIKSASKHLELSADILSSMLKESLLSEDEIEREKGVIVEELRMYKDNPASYVWDLYERLQFGDQPLGWDVGGEEKTVTSFKRADFVKYIDSLYSPQNMALSFVGKLPKDIEKLADKYFGDLPDHSKSSFEPFKPLPQEKAKVELYFKQTEQAQLVLGTSGFDRNNSKRYAARVLGLILGEGMSSRLFMQVRERRGLAYSVGAFHIPYIDTGMFAVYGGLKLDQLDEALKVIISELDRISTALVTDEELKKAKEMERGRMALRSESTNFLAEYFGSKFVLDRKLETFDEYLKKIDKVTAEEVRVVAQELFEHKKLNLQIIAPLKDKTPFEKILSA